jgi:hypothetical protein
MIAGSAGKGWRLKNLPGSFSHLLRITAAKYDADYLLIDLSPGLGSINENLVEPARLLSRRARTFLRYGHGFARPRHPAMDVVGELGVAAGGLKDGRLSVSGRCD